MIELEGGIYLGDSSDGSWHKMSTIYRNKVNAVLNVAHDLHGMLGCTHNIEYAQVGLVDGPGNPISAYCAAVLTLTTLLNRHKKVMVYCHDGGRSVAVVAMYRILKEGRVSGGPSMPHCWKIWGSVIDKLNEEAETVLPEPHAAHMEAADKLPYGILERLVL